MKMQNGGRDLAKMLAGTKSIRYNRYIIERDTFARQKWEKAMAGHKITAGKYNPGINCAGKYGPCVQKLSCIQGLCSPATRLP
jgi:hypothetical protein